MEKKISRKKDRKVKKTSKKSKSKQVSIFTLLFVLVIIAIFIGIFYGVRGLVITLKYKEYTDKMYQYGLASLYNNGKATAVSKVSNEEMLKVVLGAISGKTDIDSLYYSNESTTEKKWVDFANSTGLTQNISVENAEEKAKRIEAVMVATRALEGLRNINLEPSKLDMRESKLEKFTEEEQQIIAKAVSMGIINNKTSALSNSKILKGELNKLVITIVEKYATIYYKTTAANENGMIEKQQVSLVTDIDEMPKNYKDYPYIIDTIPTALYEYDYQMLSFGVKQTPKKAYEYIGNLYGQIDELLEYYFSIVLNVNYETITAESFLKDLDGTVLYKLMEDDVKDYVDYVKANKIKLSGKAEPLLPIIYYNGAQYVVRTKITFTILNSKTDYNLLFGDEEQKIKYNSKEITMYVDVPMGITLNSWSLRVYRDCLAKNLSVEIPTVVMEKVEE